MPNEEGESYFLCQGEPECVKEVTLSLENLQESIVFKNLKHPCTVTIKIPDSYDGNYQLKMNNLNPIYNLSKVSISYSSKIVNS